MVCMKEEEDPGEKLSQDEIISRTKQVVQGLEALKQEHHSILEGLLGTLRCLKQDDEGVLVEEKSHMIRKSLEMLELGLSEAQVQKYLQLMPRLVSPCFWEENKIKVTEKSFSHCKEAQQ